MKLGNVVSVRSGLVLSRRRSEDDVRAVYPLLTLRAIRPEGYIDPDELETFSASEVLQSEYVSHTGDIIVRLTAPYTAVLIDEKTANMVISSNFVMIRTDGTEILPEYLYWLLNTKKVKASIYQNSTSNMLGAVKAKFFSDFIISPIPLEDQKKIADMNLLAKKEAFLLRKLAEEKETYYTAIIEKFQKGVITHDNKK